MQLLLSIALKHLLARKRQSLVSLFGIVLGVAFFLAISSLMRGSENDFLRRLVDNSPHITVEDEFRNPRDQPAQELYVDGAVEILSAKPVTETRGIRGYEQALLTLRARGDLLASPSLVGQGVVNFAGKDLAITMNGMIAGEIRAVTTIEKYMLEGSIDELIANPDGMIVGSELKKNLSLSLADNLTVTSPTGQIRNFKIVGIFRTGRADFDARQTFVELKRVQALLNRPNRANRVIIKLSDPYSARGIAEQIERDLGYKSVSWQEASEDLMSTLSIRNIIMYTVVSAVLLVAAFGIYNVISTVVMEKQRDIAIMKSIGFHGADLSWIFVFEGAALGVVGTALGVPLGCAIMYALQQIEFRPPGVTEPIQMPIDWGWRQFAIASAFAMFAAILAAYLPARKTATVQPVEVLRGGY